MSFTPIYAQVSATGAPPTIADFSGIFLKIISTMFIIVQVIFFIMIVINGFNYMTSGGSPEKAKKARTGLTFTIIGFVLVFVSYFIVGLIAEVSGVSSGYTFITPCQPAGFCVPSINFNIGQ